MKLTPLVSVIIPAFNAERYIEDCINSILEQTYLNLEVIILDDGSSDNTLVKVKKYTDPRLTVISRENKGLAVTLSELVDCSRGVYIARMDADDISGKNRIAKQVERLTKNDNIVLVGSNVDYISDNSTYLGSSASVCSCLAVRKKLQSGNPIFHPTVMFRKDIYIKSGGYSRKYTKYIEDYLLWVKMLEFGEISIIQDSLLEYRVHDDAISSNVPEGLDDIVKKISQAKGEYPMLEVDYLELSERETISRSNMRKTGYRVNTLIKSIIILLKELKIRFQ